eukprot:441994-Amphidinium_carterae.1
MSVGKAWLLLSSPCSNVVVMASVGLFLVCFESAWSNCQHALVSLTVSFCLSFFFIHMIRFRKHVKRLQLTAAGDVPDVSKGFPTAQELCAQLSTK